MDIAIERLQDVAVVELPYEEIDASNAADVQRELASVVDTERRLVFDLRCLRFVDRSAPGALRSPAAAAPGASA